MRLLGKFILFIIFLMLAYKVVVLLYDKFISYNQNSHSVSLYEQANSSIMYFQQDQQWLEFSIQEKPLQIHLLSNAIINAELASAETIWHYALEYQLLDDNNELIKQKRYHHRSKVTWVKNPLSGHQFPRRFMLKKGAVPTATGKVIVHNSDHKVIRKIRLRLMSSDEDIHQLGFRVYAKQVKSDKKIKYAWQSLSEQEKIKLASKNIYSPELLRASEKYQLMKYRWQPLGPNGVEGQEYISEKLYVFDDDSIEKIEDQQIAFNVQADEHYHRIYKVPENGANLSMAIQPIKTQAAGKSDPLTVHIHWHGKGLAKQKSFRLDQEQAKKWEQWLESGMLEIIVNRPVTIKSKISVSDIDKEIELKNQEKLLRTYRVTPENTLRYAIEHAHNKSTPIRIDIRNTIVKEQFINTINMSSKTLNFQFFDEKNILLNSGTIKGLLKKSDYDRLFNLSNSLLVSDAYRYYLMVPPEVSRLVLTSEDNLLVNVYNRPPSFPYLLRIPEDYKAAVEDKEKVPVWFSLKPDNTQIMQNNRDYLLMITQPRLVKTDKNIFLDSYEWQDYAPEAQWAARYLLNPRNADIPIKKESLGGIYQRITMNESISFDFASVEGHSIISPTLIYTKHGDKLLAISVFIDNKILWKQKLAGSNGQIKLSDISIGKHDLRIESSQAAEFFINYTLPKPQGALFTKRLSHRLANNSLVFKYNKSKDEVVLSGLYQVAFGRMSRTRLQVSIAPIKRRAESAYFTLEERIFDIKPDNEHKIKVLNTINEYAGQGQRFYLPLGKDLAQQEYTVTVKRLDGPPGYLSLYTFSIGKEESIRFFKMNAEP